MRVRRCYPACLLLMALAVGAALCVAQERRAELRPVQPKRDFSKFSLFQKQVFLSAQRGVEWLQRANGVDGRFRHGVVPALARPLEGDHYLRQAGAAFALARAARFFQDERAAAVVRQALLTLLLDTEKDPQNPQARRTSFPPAVISRLGAAGLLVATIHELPAAGADLLTQADELGVFIRQQQRADGSLRDAEPGDGEQAAAARSAESCYAGLAVWGLLRSQPQRPAPWKLEVARKALAYYQQAWRANKELVQVPALTAAFTEAYLLTKETSFAEFVFEMNDWLLQLQYTQLDPRQVHWQGGFRSFADGRPVLTPPGISSASCAESLADACRVARAVGDVQRFQRYQQALERGLSFLMTLQYTEANAQHFAEWYRPEVLGGFYASQQDGTLRLDYVQHAVCALLGYLDGVANLP
jgi:hypothetical protein